ncbi:MAG: sialidase family protein [Bacteroidetes bacterium]|nr:sialidase family protein [Bacteroidota bacterium]
MIKNSILTLIGTISICLGNVYGQYINIKIDDIQMKYGPCEPSIAINPKDPNNLVAGSVLGRVYHSEDAGKTWISDTLSSPYGVYGDPCIIADNDGNFYYFHLADPQGKGQTGTKWLDRMVCQKSIDGGKKWNQGTFTGLNAGKNQDKEWAIHDPVNDLIYLTWTEFDKYGSDDPQDSSYILVSKSTDKGETWSRPLRINQQAGDCLDNDQTVEGAVPAIGPQGQVYVAWSFNQRIYFNKSLDNGRTWAPNDLKIADQPGGWTFDIPGLGRANGLPVTVCDMSDGPYQGTIYVNWSDQRNGINNTDIWISKSTDGGKIWSSPFKINDDRSGRHQFFNWISIDQVTGYLYVIYYDRRNYKDTRTDVYLAYSMDGGETFTNEKISESPFEPSVQAFFGDYNNISAYNGIIRPIWTRADGTTLSVWTALINKK